MDHQQLLNRVRAYDVVSFDIFDTLIHRCLPAPTDVFAVMRARIAASDWALVHPTVAVNFQSLRIDAEQQARADQQQRHGSSEITLDDIYGQLFRFCDIDDAAFRAYLQQLEIDTETAVIHPNTTLQRIVAELDRTGHKVIFCSDMYHAPETLHALLNGCGYADHEVFVSGALKQSKHQGGLYDLVVRQLAITPADIIHVGDNRHADVDMARKHGWHALHMPVTPPPAVTICGTDNSHADDLTQRIVDGLQQHEPSAPDDFWDDLGYHIFGPLFTGFMVWLMAQLRESTPDKLLLLARDAHFMNTMMAPFFKHADLDIPCEYIYVSRGSTLYPSFVDFPIVRLKHLIGGKSTKTLRRHLQKLGLNPEQHAADSRDVGYVSLDDTVVNADPRMQQLLQRLYEPLLRQARARREPVRQYIQSVAANHRHLALIDVGWVGNMQSSFIRLLGPAHADTAVHGYYFGLFEDVVNSKSPGHPMTGWLVNDGYPRDMQDLFWQGGVELLEFALTAPHGTTLGYREADDGTITPVLEDNPADAEHQRLAARLQAGARRFAEQFLARFGRIPPEALASPVWATPFFRLVTNPSAQQAEMLGKLTHSDAAGETSARLALAPKVDTARLSPRAVRDQLHNCYWKAGFRVRNGM